MSTYAIGDVQGCFNALERLLKEINFDASQDVLWFTGDLINRGPLSLETLRFVKSLGESQITVLGNHDLHLLAVAYGLRDPSRDDTLTSILSAPDKDELLEWLRFRPLMHVDETLQFTLVHAGVAPAWSISEALTYAQEVEQVLRHDDYMGLLANMYGNQPNLWSEPLIGYERLRLIINYFTRMRFCDESGRLDLTYKGEIKNKPDGLLPWFDVPHRVAANNKIIFGHWAALSGVTDVPTVYPLDTGCVWGHCLTAMRLNDERKFQVKC